MTRGDYHCVMLNNCVMTGRLHARADGPTVAVGQRHNLLEVCNINWNLVKFVFSINLLGRRRIRGAKDRRDSGRPRHNTEKQISREGFYLEYVHIFTNYLHLSMQK